MRLFQLLRIYRAFRGEKLKTVAESIGITPRELSALEDGRKIASGPTLARVLSWLLLDEPNQKEENNGRAAAE